MYIDIINDICKANGFEIAKQDINLATEEEYAQIRMDWFGASDSSKLLNVNPFPKGTREDLIYEKITHEVDESIGKKASVRMGKDIEDIILHKCKQILTEGELEKPTNMYGNPDNHLGINFDAVYVVNGVGTPVEIKAVTKYGRKYYNFSLAMFNQHDGTWLPVNKEPEQSIDKSLEVLAEKHGIPIYYYTQLQQQMMALNSDYGYLAVMDVDNWDVHVFKVYANKTVWKELQKESRLAWLKVDTARKLRAEKLNK